MGWATWATASAAFVSGVMARAKTSAKVIRLVGLGWIAGFGVRDAPIIGRKTGFSMAIRSRRRTNQLMFLALVLGLSQLQAAILPAGFTETQFGSNLKAAPTAMA